MSQKSNSIALIDLGGWANQGPQERAVSPFRRVGRQTLLERTVRRLSESSLLDGIAIVGDNEFTGLIGQSCTEPAIWLPTDEATSIARASHAAEELGAQWIVSVRPTSVFVDPMLIDRLLVTAWGEPKCDVVTFMSLQTSAMVEQGAGLAGDVCHRRVLKQLARQFASNDEPRSLSQLIASMPEAFACRMVPLPSVLDHTDLSFMLKSESDLDRALMILEATREDCDYRDLVPLFSHFARAV